MSRAKASFFGYLDLERLPNIDQKISPKYAADPGIQILTKKRCLASANPSANVEKIEFGADIKSFN